MESELWHKWTYLQNRETFINIENMFYRVKGFPGSSDGKEAACNVQSLGWEDALEKGSYPPQYSRLENSMDRGSWRAIVHGVTKGRTWLINTHFHHREQTCGCQVRWLDWEFGTSRCKPLHAERINNKVLLYSTGNYIQYPVINHNRKEEIKNIKILF